MNIRKILQVFAAACVCMASLSPAFAQAKGPRQETLLNGLKVYIWNDPSAPTVSVKLRVHSGSSFDPQGKESTMRMLSEAIFPSNEARQFFIDDLQGSFALTSNYDYIQIDTSGRSSDLIVLLETLANAVANPQLDKETTDAVRLRVQSDLDAKLADPAYLADQIVSERLFGTFPYGRPAFGTKESLAKIDFADLRFAYDRFFGADNASLSIRGNIQPDVAYRAARRFFGAWLKSDRRVPSTFKQPSAPDTSLEVKNLSSDSGAEVRHAVRGFSRADGDHAASQILTEILDARLKQHVGKVAPNARASVRNDAFILPGQLVFSVSSISPEAKVKLYPAGDSVDARSLIPSLLADPVSISEFEKAKAIVLAAAGGRMEDLWLDSDTYRITPAASQAAKIRAVTSADVQKLAGDVKVRPAVSLWLVKGIGSN
jgi:zinc protease